jgi:exodeoxyribonuclease VII large subunit
MRQRGLFDPEQYDPGEQRGRPPQQAPKNTAPAKPQALSVSELTARIKRLLEPRFGEVWVEGELSNFKPYASGHCYFTLKDADAQLSCVLWRTAVSRLKFRPQDGAKVLARGRLSVYEPRGNYQLVVDRLEPTGIGALAAAFEALKEKLAREGLFEAARKKPLPSLPQRIGLVTSLHGAAIRDLLKVILARWPRMTLILAPVRVQGEGAAQEIAQAIAELNRLQAVDVMIVGRGGGSMEDLWAFNEEVVARAIAASRIPVISAIGHEIDFTIADFVADLRAATPSHAGELVVPVLADLEAHLRRLQQELPAGLLTRLRLARARLNTLSRSWSLRDPRQRVEHARQGLDELQERMDLALQQRLHLARVRLQHLERSWQHLLPQRRTSEMRERLDALQQRATQAGVRRIREARELLAGFAGRLEGLSPLKVLERGYSVTLNAAGKGIRSLDEVELGTEIRTRLRQGQGWLYSRVERKEPE